jgi:hypothetical protein
MGRDRQIAVGQAINNTHQYLTQGNEVLTSDFYEANFKKLFPLFLELNDWAKNHAQKKDEEQQ